VRRLTYREVASRLEGDAIVCRHRHRNDPDTNKRRCDADGIVRADDDAGNNDVVKATRDSCLETWAGHVDWGSA